MSGRITVSLRETEGASLMVQWLRLHASFIAGGTDLIPGLGTKIPHAVDMTKTSKQTGQAGNSEGKEVILKV